MYDLYIRGLAKADIQQIVDYYDELTNPHITDNFLKDLYANLDTLINNPFLFQKKYKAIRICYLNSFPFGIHYIVHEKNIEVIAVLHNSRNPEIWRKR